MRRRPERPAFPRPPDTPTPTRPGGRRMRRGDPWQRAAEKAVGATKDDCIENYGVGPILPRARKAQIETRRAWSDHDALFLPTAMRGRRCRTGQLRMLKQHDGAIFSRKTVADEFLWNRGSSARLAGCFGGRRQREGNPAERRGWRLLRQRLLPVGPGGESCT